MLRKDLDFVPQSPKKPSGGERSGLSSRNGRGHTRGKSLPSSKLITVPDEAEDMCRDLGPAFVPDRERGSADKGDARKGSKVKTTEEKKELLGTMLGNVDALVESVRKAGIWGLG